jgi:hypothetical protein
MRRSVQGRKGGTAYRTWPSDWALNNNRNKEQIRNTTSGGAHIFK